MDPDHLDVYATFEEMAESYIDFMGRVVDGGYVLLHSDVIDAIPKSRIEGLLEGLSKREVGVIIYGETGHFELREYEVRDGRVQFSFWNALDSHEWHMDHKMPGKHNAMNAMAALAVAHLIGATGSYSVKIEREHAIRAIANFRGIRRRFEILYTSPSLSVIDDYAHHPNEISAAIEAARRFFEGKRISGVFQPHLYSRTRDFYRECGGALSALDEVVIVEIYPARELPIKGVSSELIFEEVKNQFKFLTTKQELTDLLRSLEPEVLLFMGAGDLDRMIPGIIEDII
jgi:UDP-N-acetylmuramate--alanine ligase